MKGEMDKRKLSFHPEIFEAKKFKSKIDSNDCAIHKDENNEDN